MRFDAFLAGLPAGIQLFSLLQSNPALLKLIGDDHGRGAAARRDHHPPPACVRRPARSGAAVRAARPRLSVGAARRPSSKACGVYEEVLDRLRIFAAEQKFLIGVRLLDRRDRRRRAPARRFPTSPT